MKQRSCMDVCRVTLRRRWRRSGARTKAGIIITASYLTSVMLTVLIRRDEFLELELNALGDFLAGSFAPLAFLWLVIGYFQQGEELRLQAKELRNSVEQQTAMVSLARERSLAEEAALLPRFFITGSGGSSNGMITIWNRELHNGAGEATQIRCELETDVAEFVLESVGEVARMPRGSGQTLCFRGPERLSTIATLRVRYVDLKHRKGEQSILILVSRGGMATTPLPSGATPTA